LSILFTPRNFSEAALVLTVRIDTDNNGVDRTGTGFLFQIMDGNKMAIALVSNRHVFQDGNGSIELTFHAASATKNKFELGQTITLAGSGFTHRYVPHPASEIDLAAAIVNAVGEHGKGSMLAKEHIATPAQFDQLSCGDPVWFVGYPNGLRDELHNLPLMRRGWISSLPRLPFDGRPEFVIDAQAFPGSSGSPVFAQFGEEMRLVGVLAETAQRVSPVLGATSVVGPLTVEEVVGLGYVIASTQLPPLLEEVRSMVTALVAKQSGQAP
jgi:hypothetical protein